MYSIINHNHLYLYFIFSLLSFIINTLRPKRNEQHFADNIFKRIFFNENVWISIKISLKFVPKGPINNIPALIQIMAWRRSGNKPLSEPMMISLPTHICVTRPQWVKEDPLDFIKDCHHQVRKISSWSTAHLHKVSLKWFWFSFAGVSFQQGIQQGISEVNHTTYL